jgi:hypothetical protein
VRPLGIFGANPLPAGGLLASFDPAGGGGRRSYPFSNGNFASPNYIDASIPWGGNPYAGRFVLQMRYTMDRFEGINGALPNHVYALSFDGTQIFRINNDVASVFRDTGWFDVQGSHCGTQGRGTSCR